MEPNLMRRGVRENKKFKFHSDLEESKELDQQKEFIVHFCNVSSTRRMSTKSFSNYIIT